MVQQINSKREFVVIHAHLKKQEKSQINNLIYHLKELEKAKWKDSGNNEIITITVAVNDKEEFKKLKTSMKARAGFLIKKKNEKFLSCFIKKKNREDSNKKNKK